MGRPEVTIGQANSGKPFCGFSIKICGKKARRLAAGPH
ncbi:hypothetical protein AGRO_2746 [Agrobacterium sp. ATCC 31749]|nr:hypothetical protein AGRO_2746 [Agrobacterium sp. ATCC 31749]KJX89449.1 hypothetical protein SY94_0483 [Agrobacterium tumefaciens]